MYMLKAQKKLADIEKKEREDRRSEDLGGLRIVQGAVSPDIPSDGPKGAKKKVKYVGSFKVYPPPGLSGQALSSAVSAVVWDKASVVNPKRVSNPISGTLVVNRYGVRLYKDKNVFMSYPIKKISYCTAIPRNSTFAIVAKSIQPQQEEVTYCHIFALSNAEQASELSQYMSHAFKLAVAQSTLRRNMKAAEGKKGNDKDKKKPWEVLKRKDKDSSPKKPPPSPTPAPPPRAELSTSKANNRKSEYLNPPPPVAPGYSPLGERRMASSDITPEGLQREIGLLKQQIASAEMQLQTISPSSDAALEVTIMLSSYEDKLHVKEQQLYNLQQMPLPPPPSAPMVTISPTPSDQYLPPPDYDAMFGGGAVGGVNNYQDSLEDAEWYQAGLPREVVMDILSFQPPGSFIVRDSSSNPGCHALSMKSPDGHIMHYLIAKDGRGYFIQGCNRRHPTLLSLVTHHATVVEFLPTQLSLGSTNPMAHDHTHPPPQQGGGAPPGYPWVIDSDDSDMDDDEMVDQLQRLQLINP